MHIFREIRNLLLEAFKGGPPMAFA